MPVLLLFLIGGMVFCPSGATAAEPAGPTAAALPLAPAAPDPVAELDAAQVQELFQWLSRHAPDPSLLSQDALNRAALRSLLKDARTGAVVLTIPKDASAARPALPPLLARLGSTSAYARVGTLGAENVAALSAFLTQLPPEVTTLLLDLRVRQAPDAGAPAGSQDAGNAGGQNVRPPQLAAPPPSDSLAGAVALVSLFLPEKTPLYQRIAPPAAAALQVSASPPVWTRRVWLLIDHDTPPPAELAAHLLVRHLPALTFGSPTSGFLTETIDRPLGTHQVLRLPAATVSWPDGSRLTGTPLVPKIAVRPRPDSRQALLSLTDPAALAAHLTETDRPRPNEAALMACLPPELLPSSPLPPNATFPDPVLQQAVDLLGNAAHLKLDAPEEIKRAQPAR